MPKGSVSIATFMPPTFDLQGMARGRHRGAHRGARGGRAQRELRARRGARPRRRPRAPLPRRAVTLESYDKNMGFEIIILREIEHRLKFKVIYNKTAYTDFGFKLKNGSYSHLYQDLYKKEANIIIGTLLSDSIQAEDFAFTRSHCRTSGSCYVPLAKRKALWSNIVTTFDLPIWFMILLSITAMSIAYYALSNNSISYSLLYIYSILLSSSPNQPTILRLRVIFIIWAFSVLIISSSYQGVLLVFLFKARFHEQISTIEELVESKIQYGGAENSKSLLYA